MFLLDTEAALLNAFRPRDRPTVHPPPHAKYPLLVRDYLAWPHPSGGFTYLLFAVRGGVPTGITFETNGGASAPQLCDWCHCQSSGAQVGTLTADRNSKRRVGANVCMDLSCKAKLEELANLTGANVRPAIEKLVERMGRFAAEGLGIDLSGAGR
jgi:FBP C-terminal treble-clef zinc-finger